MKNNGILRQVAQLGEPVLRKIAVPVSNVEETRIQQLIDDLLATIKDVHGVGMAAPQVYESLRIFVVASNPNPRYPNAPKMNPTAVINPEILSNSKDKEKDWEGCLSIPGIRGLVPRYKSIRVRFTTRDGKVVEKIYKDFIARIFQHEFDHLEGIVFLDRLESNKDIVSEKEYQKIVTRK
ncbi:peptide deformylase [Candidatus Gottesmanbacteria bacterium]|nr:peptide deformylase [Candidatus Gottesmanbacteria bacterium]